MGKQALYDAVELGGELIADVDLPPYIAVGFKTGDKTKVVPASATIPAIAIVGRNEEDKVRDGAGGVAKTNGGWKAGQIPLFYKKGTVPVKVGAEVASGDKLVPTTNGLLIPAAASTFTTFNLGATPTGAQINTAANNLITEIQAAISDNSKVMGEVMPGEDGTTNDIIYMIMK